MASLFNADEIYQVAINMEDNAGKFYRGAAARATNAETRAMFAELAEWEDGHRNQFSTLRIALGQSSRAHSISDSTGEIADYLRMIASKAVFRDDAGLKTLLDRCTDPTEVLRYAVRFEEESLKFYETMKRLVPEHFGGASIEKLIEEERGHAQMLRGKIFALSGKRPS